MKRFSITQDIKKLLINYTDSDLKVQTFRATDRTDFNRILQVVQVAAGVRSQMYNSDITKFTRTFIDNTDNEQLIDTLRTIKLF